MSIDSYELVYIQPIVSKLLIEMFIECQPSIDRDI